MNLRGVCILESFFIWEMLFLINVKFLTKERRLEMKYSNIKIWCLCLFLTCLFISCSSSQLKRTNKEQAKLATELGTERKQKIYHIEQDYPIDTAGRAIDKIELKDI